MPHEQLTAAIYARVSSDQQSEAGTINSQVEALVKRVQDDGLALDDELKFVDDGYSGATLVRPALERLRDLAFGGAVDRLYVHSPDRLARKYAYQVLLVEEVQRCGVELVFLNHELGQTPEQDLLLQVQGMVAEYERAKIMERSRRGKRHAAGRGSVNVLGGAPYGYRYVDKHEGSGEARYDVNLAEARVVQQIFQWVGLDRVSIGEVCRRLIQQGISTRTGKSKWDRTTVWGMLKNPAYKGMAAFGKTRAGPFQPPRRPQRGRAEQPRRACTMTDVPADEWIYIPVPAIIDEDLFETVQEQLAENRKRSRQSRRGARYLLQGLVVCEQCGYAFYGKPVGRSGARNTKRYVYYRCTGTDAYRFGGQRVCGNKQVRADMLDDAVWNDVCALLADPQRIEQEYERRLANESNSDAAYSVEQMRTQIQKVKRGIARITDAYEEGWLDREDFEQRMERAKDRLTRLQTQVQGMVNEEVERRELRLVIGQLSDFGDRVAGGLQGADWSTRREIIRALVKEIRVGEEGVRIVYRVTPPPFADTPARGVLQDCWRGERAALWRPLFGGHPGSIRHHHLRLEHPVHETQDSAVMHPLRQSVQQALVVHPVEELRQVNVHHDVESRADVLLRFGDGGVRTSVRTETVTARMERGFEDRLQDLEHGLLNHTVHDVRDAQPPLPASGLGDPDSPDVAGPIRPAQQIPVERREEGSSALDDLVGALTVHTCRAFVARDMEQRLRQVRHGRCAFQQVSGLTCSGGRVMRLLVARYTQQPSLRLGYVRGVRGAAPLRAVGKREHQLV